MKFPWVKCTWDEMYVGRNVRGVTRTWGEKYVGINVCGMKCTVMECPGVKCLQSAMFSGEMSCNHIYAEVLIALMCYTVRFYH